MASGDRRKVATKCAAKTKIDFSKIDACTKSALGNQLEHQYAVQTDQLQPPHQYVPWVTVNGVHTEEIENEALSDLIGLICRTYKVSRSWERRKNRFHRHSRESIHRQHARNMFKLLFRTFSSFASTQTKRMNWHSSSSRFRTPSVLFLRKDHQYLRWDVYEHDSWIDVFLSCLNQSVSARWQEDCSGEKRKYRFQFLIICALNELYQSHSLFPSNWSWNRSLKDCLATIVRPRMRSSSNIINIHCPCWKH